MLGPICADLGKVDYASRSRAKLRVIFSRTIAWEYDHIEELSSFFQNGTASKISRIDAKG